MSGSSDNTLLELFREEVRANVQTLNDGLVALERQPGDLSLIEPLMRAAHSVKGAARVVNLAPAVQLAHAAEDCLVAAQQGRIALDSTDVDRLLQAADLLAGMAEALGPHLSQWLAAGSETLAALCRALEQRAQGVANATAAPTAHAPTEIATPADATVRHETAPAAMPLAARWSAAVDADRQREFAASPLLELFQAEGAAHCETLLGATAAAASSPQEDALLSAARAAAALRSAARLLGAQAPAELATALEHALLGAHEAAGPPSAEAQSALHNVAVALQACMSAVGPDYAAWLGTHAADAATALAGLLQAGEAAPRAASHGSDAAAVAACAPPVPPPPASPSASPAAETPAPARQAAELVAGEATGGPAQPAAEQVVRVTAQSLTRLMGLAGESLVEARWLQPFAKSLLQLKRQQALLHDQLQRLAQTLPSVESSDRRAALLAEAIERLGECRRMLGSQLDEFEQRARNADDLNSRLYQQVAASRMRPFGDAVQGFGRMVRDLARQLGKQVELRIRGEDVDVDRDILEELKAPLNHLLRNALDHGIESPAERSAAGKPPAAVLELEARHQAGMLVIRVRDDGRGIDPERIRRKVVERQLTDARMAQGLSVAELLEFLFLPSFSTAAEVTEVSGRGVGLDVVHSMVQAAGGSVRVESQLGQGAIFILELPITRSVLRAVLVNVAGEPYAFPHNRIDRIVRVRRDQLRSLEHRHYFEVDGASVGLVLADQLLELPSDAPPSDELLAILFSHRDEQYGLIVDELCGERDLVVRPLDPRLGKIPNIQAAAILDDGSPALIVDLDDVRRALERRLEDQAVTRAPVLSGGAASRKVRRVLVVDDSITVREVQRQLLTQRGYEVTLAVDGMDGWHALARGRFDLVITDIDMPRLNGIDLVRKIKGDPRYRETPVIIVSYKDQDDVRLQGMEAGADYYLAKSSFHDDTLLGAVRDLIGEARG